MARTFTYELPIERTLPLLTGGGSLSNLQTLMVPYEKAAAPYGIVLGGLIFNSDKPPREMARTVVQKVANVQRELQRV